MTAIGGSAASVVAAIRDEVEAELEKRQKELEETVAAAGREPPDEGPPGAERAARVTLAREQARERLAHEDWLDSREALQSRERWIQLAAEAGRGRLREDESGAESPELLLRLAAEGISRLPGDSFDVIASERVAPRLDAAWCRRLEEKCGKRQVRLAPAGALRPEGGCLVRTADGRITFDNSFEARARRFETAWRGVLAGLYG
jgi:vacuolar-type H+-ATPase subunit E/Vma4